MLTKVGGAEEKEGASLRRWGGNQADNVGEGRGHLSYTCCPSHPCFFSSAHRSTICSQTWRVCICFPFSNSLCKKWLMKWANMSPTGSATVLCSCPLKLYRRKLCTGPDRTLARTRPWLAPLTLTSPFAKATQCSCTSFVLDFKVSLNDVFFNFIH